MGRCKFPHEDNCYKNITIDTGILKYMNVKIRRRTCLIYMLGLLSDVSMSGPFNFKYALQVEDLLFLYLHET